MSQQLRPRYLCKECGVLYGPLQEKRPSWGHCPGCWDVWLALQGQNTRKLFVLDAEAKGQPAIWLEYQTPVEASTT